MHIEGDIDKVLGDRFTDHVPLLICRKFQELLAKVVTKGIWEAIRNIRAIWGS